MDQLQIDLGLAAAGDAGQQEGLKTTKAGANRFERRALLRIQRQLGLQQPAAAVLSRRTGATRFDSHQAFFQQQIEAVLVQLQFAQQGMGQAVGMLRDDLQGFTLTRSARQSGIVRIGAVRQAPVAFQTGFGRFTLAQQDRQCPAQGVAQAVLVVLGGPQTELEQGGRQRRRAVQQLDGRSELFQRHFALIAQLYQHTDDLAPAERHAQAHARLQRAGSCAVWWQVVEQAAQRRRQRQTEDAGRHAVILDIERRW